MVKCIGKRGEIQEKEILGKQMRLQCINWMRGIKSLDRNNGFNNLSLKEWRVRPEWDDWKLCNIESEINFKLTP